MNIDLNVAVEDLQHYLTEKGWLKKNEPILGTEKPGEGNMNVVLRVRTGLRTFILKQSRPYVQKYQQIQAPLERIDVERQFYQSVHLGPLNQYFPHVLAYDNNDHLLMLEDLGACTDMASMYSGIKLKEEHLDQLVKIAKAIHSTPVTQEFPKNLELRKLNHQHIFELPFMEDNGFSLDEVQGGLQKLAEPYKKDSELKSIINTLGKKYLSPGHVLIHGDYYPGSWMSCSSHIHVIDPEFCFVGFAEFDIGVLLGHLIMATSEKKHLGKIVAAYGQGLDWGLVEQIAGIEIMRRIIGLAQLPLTCTLSEKAKLLQWAHAMVTS